MTFPPESVSDRVARCEQRLARCEKALRHVVAAIGGLRLDSTGRDNGLHPEVQAHLEGAARELGADFRAPAGPPAAEQRTEDG